MLVTDLDNTLVGDDVALDHLNQWLTDQRNTQGAKVVYSTGRSLTLYQQLQAEAGLIDPDVLIASVGTEIYRTGQATPDSGWSETLTPGWNRDQVFAVTAHFSDLVLQAETEQSPFKVSFLLAQDVAVDVLSELESALEQRGVDGQLIYSSGKDLDILPRHANKGSAMTFIRQQLRFAAGETIVCGDSGNDIALFAGGEECGIIVGNAQPELLQWHRHHPNPQRYLATAHCAAGILEGLKYFGFR
nr:sucrose-phosphate phosphatase [Myxacorys almedinensis]